MAIATGFCTDNPAGEAMAGALPVVRITKNVPVVIPHEEVAEVLSAVRASEARAATKLAFGFLVLTVARWNDVRGATWDEIDLDERKWTIPRERRRTGFKHLVPLSAPALALLATARKRTGGRGLVFRSQKGRHLSNATLSKLLRHLEVDATPHGFRTSFRIWCAENGVPCDRAERSLAHAVGDPIEEAFHRHDLFESRRQLMEDWGAYVMGTGTKDPNR